MKNISIMNWIKNTILRLSQTQGNNLKKSVGNDVYNLTKYDKIQITDTTIIKLGKSGGYLLQNWNIKCNDKIIKEKYQISLNQQKHTALLLIQEHIFTTYRFCVYVYREKF